MRVDELKALTYEPGDDGVAVITLNRPERLNAWTSRMEGEYRWALDQAGADPAVRVIVVTGAGRGFCAGADFEALNQLSDGAEYGGRDGGEASSSVFGVPLQLTKPVIAAINGAAAGVGFVLMCFADIRFAAAGAKLTTAFARLGLPAEHGVSWMLGRLVGPARAADLLFSARVVLSEEAAEMGLVNRVYPSGELLPATLAYARRMATECSPSSLATIKRQLWADFDRTVTESATESLELLARMLREPDFKEGVAALQEKRLPTWA